jgi:hypothetical protein
VSAIVDTDVWCDVGDDTVGDDAVGDVTEGVAGLADRTPGLCKVDASVASPFLHPIAVTTATRNDVSSGGCDCSGDI